jgi:predicted GNAT superfamily acetyltransferase
MHIDVLVADASHFVYADEICEEILLSARERGTGIARRTPEYIQEKMAAGKAIIAISDKGEFAGFSYIETWGGKEYVANSGLIVAHKFRGIGLAMRIKERVFQLSRERFPSAKIFSITTGAAVMKMNYELGFRPVTFAALTDDPEFWKGCQGCRNYQILEANEYRMCLCTGLLYDPAEHIEVKSPAHPEILNMKDGEQRTMNNHVNL